MLVKSDIDDYNQDFFLLCTHLHWKKERNTEFYDIKKSNTSAGLLGDLVRIQTWNLHSRNVVLYSVELRSQLSLFLSEPFLCQSDLVLPPRRIELRSQFRVQLIVDCGHKDSCFFRFCKLFFKIIQSLRWFLCLTMQYTSAPVFRTRHASPDICHWSE